MTKKLPAAEKTENPQYFSAELVKSIDRVYQFPLTLVQAPMGYGKTTAMRRLFESETIPCHWLKIYDDSIEAFWTNFCRLLARIDGKLAQKLKKLDLPTDRLAAQEAIELFQRFSVPEKAVIVIDDFHMLGSDTMFNFFLLLSQSELRNFHFVLNARFFPFASLEELVLKSHVHMINHENLKLSSEDIVSYFSLCGISIGRPEATQLQDDTGGWISAIYLQMLEYKREKGFRLNKSIFNLIHEAVYSHFSKELQKFCMVILPLKSFTRQQIEFIWQKKNGNSLLNELLQKNAFINYDKHSGIFNAHRLFIRFIHESEDFSKLDQSRYLKRTAEWFSSKGDHVEAMATYLHLNDHDKFLEVMQEEPGITFTSKKMTLYRDFFSRCPKELYKKHVPALLKYAYYLVFSGGFSELPGLCNEVEKAVNTGNKLSPDQRNHFLGELELLKSLSVFNNIPRMAVHQTNAKKLMNSPTRLFSDSSRWTFGSPSVLYLYHRESGRLAENVELLIRHTHNYSSITNGHGSGGEYLMEAEWHFIQGDFAAATVSLQKAIALADSANENSVLLCALMLQIKLELFNGRFESALQLVRNHRKKLLLDNDYKYIHTLEICEIWIYAILGQVNQISSEFMATDQTSLRLGFPAIGNFHILKCRYLLLASQPAQLIGQAVLLSKLSSIFPNVLGQIYANIFSAAGNLLINKTDDAMSFLKSALELAVPDNILMPFVENCDYLATLLEKCSSEKGYAAAISKIMLLYRELKTAKDKIAANFFTEGSLPLTSRELQIARLAVDNKTNTEIGDILFISVNTVKMTLKKIYAKLSVNNRTLLKQTLESSKGQHP
ncbi:MAG: LuxR C-terminal-related transcriptional regulator [Candidatus Riflebacteria bacterium]|nr:LuxR C-terminal-related transcriptional regulator [Candidatus Riflebacteria bacterium]